MEGKRHCGNGLQESRSRQVGTSLSPPSSTTPLLSPLIFPLSALRCSQSIPRSFLLRGLGTTTPSYRPDPQDVLMPGSFSPPRPHHKRPHPTDATPDHPAPFVLHHGKRHTVVSPWLQGVHSQTPTGCLKPWVVPNPIYITFFLYIHTSVYFTN